MLSVDLPRRSKRFPYWLRQSIKTDADLVETKRILCDLHINTVCQRARCPNIYDCFSRKRCTFLILGKFCTRSCRFCAIKAIKRRDHLEPPAKEELFNIKEAVKKLGLENVSITSVTRDDLDDGGAGHFADCIDILRSLDRDLNEQSGSFFYKSTAHPEERSDEGSHEILQPFGLQDDPSARNNQKNSPRGHLNIEVLVPDFLGKKESIEKIVSMGADVFSHNLETVPRLYNKVRPQADYKRSLDVLGYAKVLDRTLLTKSGLMVGLGEDRDEVYNVMKDLKEAGCDIVTIGQYLQPDLSCLEVEEFLHPDDFVRFSQWAEALGFKKFSCSPFTRSSNEHMTYGAQSAT